MATIPNVKVVILAGGFGTRIRHLLSDVPKPMAVVEGRPFLEWVIRYFQQFGFQDFVLSTGHLSEVIETFAASQPVSGARIRCCPETTPLGTGGGFLNCVASETERPDVWLVTNGDSLVVSSPKPLVDALAEPRFDAALMGLSLADAGRFGSLDLDASGKVLRAFREKRPGPGVINGGIYAFRDSLVRTWPATRPLSFEYDLFPGLAAADKVAVHRVDAPFIDIGTPETFAAATDFLQTNSGAFAVPSP